MIGEARSFQRYSGPLNVRFAWHRGRRWPRSLLAILPLIVAACGSAEKPFFPTGQGSVWTYDSKIGATPMSTEARITSSRRDGDHTTVVMQWKQDGQPFQDETYLVTSREVARSKAGAYGSTSLNPPIPILRLPMKVGDRWTWDGKVTVYGQASLPGSAVMHVLGTDRIKTAAGDFDAFRVGMNITIKSGSGKPIGQEESATLWFAPGVGLVKQMSDHPQPDGTKREVSGILAKCRIER